MLGMHFVMHGIYCWPHAKKNKDTKKWKGPFDVGNIELGEISTNLFIVSVIVTCDMVSFGVEFQSDSVNDGRVSDG